MKKMILALMLTLTACGGETDDNYYEQKKLVITSSEQLIQNNKISAETVVIESNKNFTMAKIGENDLTIKAKKLVIKEPFLIEGSKGRADCGQSGSDSGDVSLNVKKLIGNLSVDLVGEYSGFTGTGYLKTNYVRDKIVKEYQSLSGYNEFNCEEYFPEIITYDDYDNHWTYLSVRNGNGGNFSVNHDLDISEGIIHFIVKNADDHITPAIPITTNNKIKYKELDRPTPGVKSKYSVRIDKYYKLYFDYFEDFNSYLEATNGY